MYKVDGLSKLAEKFRAQNWDLSLATPDGIIIQIIDIDGWLHVMLDIGEYVSSPSTAIRKAAPLLASWKNRLLSFQGAWRVGGENELMERLLHKFEHGESYKELAELINHSVEDHLREFLAYRQEVDSTYPEYKHGFDQDLYFYAYSKEFKHSCMGLRRSRDLLRAIGLRDSEIEQELRDGLDRIKAGKKPFPPNKPVSKLKMISTLDTWREGKVHKAIRDREQKEKQEIDEKKMNARKQIEIGRIMLKVQRRKERIEEIGEKMIEAIEMSDL